MLFLICYCGYIIYVEGLRMLTTPKARDLQGIIIKMFKWMGKETLVAINNMFNCIVKQGTTQD